MWLMLMPRETDLIMRPTGALGADGVLLRNIQQRIDVARNEVDLPDAYRQRIRSAQRNWRNGLEKQFTALVQAMDRHGE